MALQGAPRGADARALALASVVGVAHAAGIALVVRWLDYPVGGLARAPGGTVGALVGLSLLFAVPTFVAVRLGLVMPLLAAVLEAGWALHRELTTARPQFSEIGGHTVVSGPRFVDAYVEGWYVWLLAVLLLGAAEDAARRDLEALPDPRTDGRLGWLRSRDRGAALRVAGVFGCAHATVLLLLAADARYFVPGAFLPSPWYVGLGVLAWTVIGLVAIGGLTGYLLSSRGLVAPTVGLAWLVRETGWTQGLPLPDDALPIYFLGWFFFAGVLLVIAVGEWALRLGVHRLRAGPRTGVDDGG